jgi:hypothetical protein
MSWGDASSHRPSPAFRNLDYEDEPGNTLRQRSWLNWGTRGMVDPLDEDGVNLQASGP